MHPYTRLIGGACPFKGAKWWHDPGRANNWVVQHNSGRLQRGPHDENASVSRLSTATALDLGHLQAAFQVIQVHLPCRVILQAAGQMIFGSWLGVFPSNGRSTGLTKKAPALAAVVPKSRSELVAFLKRQTPPWYSTCFKHCFVLSRKITSYKRCKDTQGRVCCNSTIQSSEQPLSTLPGTDLHFGLIRNRPTSSGPSHSSSQTD